MRLQGCTGLKSLLYTIAVSEGLGLTAGERVNPGPLWGQQRARTRPCAPAGSERDIGKEVSGWKSPVESPAFDCLHSIACIQSDPFD